MSIRLVLVFTVIATGFTTPAAAITFRDDRSASSYQSLGNSHPNVCYVESFGSYGSGVLIGSQWILTAAHVVDSGCQGVAFASSSSSASPEDTYFSGGIILQDQWNGDNSTEGVDLALVRLQRPVIGVTPAMLYSGSAEIGQTVSWVGFGRTGNGSNGATIDGGTRHGMENVLDERGDENYEWNNRLLLSDFDSPDLDLTNRMGSSSPLNLEGGAAPGDSGGGVFIESGGESYLVGINSFVASWPLDADFGYNAVSAATAVSPWLSWIQANTATLGETLTWNDDTFGDFHNYHYWDSQLFEDVSPISADCVRFTTIGSPCTTYFDRDGYSKRLQVESADLTLDLRGHAYTVGEAVEIGYATTSLGHHLTPKNGTLTASQILIGRVGTLYIESGSEVSATTQAVGAVKVFDGSNMVGFIEQTGGTNTADTLTLAPASNSSGTYTLSGGSLSSTQQFIGEQGTGIAFHSGGVNSTTDLMLGVNSGSSGAYSLSGSAQLSVLGTLTVGVDGTGNFSQTGGTVSNHLGVIGSRSGSTGTVTVDGTGSTWTNSRYLSIGDMGNGTLQVTGGGTVSSDNSIIGSDSGSTGSVTVDGTGSTWTNGGLYVGGSGSGTLEVTGGGTVSSAGGGYIGSRSGSSGSVTVDGTGSTWTMNSIIPEIFSVGGSGNGTLQVTGGGTVRNLSGIIGIDSGSTGSVTVDGIGSTWTSIDSLDVGYKGSGTLQVTDGGAVRCNFGEIGSDSGSTGSVTVDGTGSIWTNSDNLYVGNSGSGSLAVAEGGTVSNTYGYIGSNSGSTGSVTVDGSGSTWTNGNDVYVGYQGDGTMSITNGGSVTSFHGYIAHASGSTSTVAVDGSGSTWTTSSALAVGREGNGDLIITNGGRIEAYQGNIGRESSSTGNAFVYGSGSTWTIRNWFEIGTRGKGILNIANGGAVSSWQGWIGRYSGSSGVVTIDGNGSTWSNSSYLNVGGSGNGTLNIVNGGAVSSGSCTIAASFGSASEVTVDGNDSTWNCGQIDVGGGGNGTLNIINGGTVRGHGGMLTIGSLSGATGVVTVDGSDSTWTNSVSLYVGREGNGTLNILDGAQVMLGGVTYVAFSETATGSINFGENGGNLTTEGLVCSPAQLTGTGIVNTRGIVSDVDLVFDKDHGNIQSFHFQEQGKDITVNLDLSGTSRWSGVLGAGYEGAGSLAIRDSVQLVAPEGYVGFKSGSTGDVIVEGEGSTWDNSGWLYVGRYGDATLSIVNGGLVSVHGTLYIDYDADGNGFINMISGGMLALFGDADDSLNDFLELIEGTDAIRYWDYSNSDWADIAGASYGNDYRLEYLGEGELAGYTVLTVGFAPTDFDQDGDSDLVDINALTAVTDLTIGLPIALSDPKYDLTGDDMINTVDLDQWLVDAATINGFGSPYLKGDANLDGDVDIWAFDGSGDAQLLSNNLGKTTGAVWGDGDFNGDGDVDVWAFDGSGDAQQLSSNLGSTNDAATGTAEAIYNAITGELSFDVGEGIGVIGVQANGLDHGAVDAGSALGTPAQNGGGILAWFDASGLPVVMAEVGAVLPAGLTAEDIGFSYTPIGGDSTVVPVTVVVPEPSTIAMLLVLGAIALCWRRRGT